MLASEAILPPPPARKTHKRKISVCVRLKEAGRVVDDSRRYLFDQDSYEFLQERTSQNEKFAAGVRFKELSRPRRYVAETFC